MEEANTSPGTPAIVISTTVQDNSPSLKNNNQQDDYSNNASSSNSKEFSPRKSLGRWFSNGGFNKSSNALTLSGGGGTSVETRSVPASPVQSTPTTKQEVLNVPVLRTPDVDRVKRQRAGGHRRSASGILPNLMSLLNSPSSASDDSLKRFNISQNYKNKI